MSMQTQETVNFATVGEVFADGVSLIFDGQDEATQKHYKVNTSILFHAGDRVKILADSGTYVVEYVVGAPLIADDGGEGAVAGLLPAGGTEGQVLRKSGAEDYAAAWETLSGLLPSGGSAGQSLIKSSAVNYAAGWGIPASAGGVTNQRITSRVIQLQTDYSGNFFIRDGTGTWKQLTTT